MMVSVIIPTRNRSAILAQTIGSVLRQRDIQCETVVVDEGSSDDTQAMVSRLAGVRVIRHDVPQGLAAARNRGAAEARGEWLAFLDDDDLWAPDKLRLQLDAAKRAGCAWAYAGSVNFEGCRIVHAEPPPDPAEVTEALPHMNVISGGGSNVIISRTAWNAAGPFDTAMRMAEDWEMWIRLARLGPPACVRQPLIAKRIHPSNMSLDTERFVSGALHIERKHQIRADWGRIYRWLAERHLRSGSRSKAAFYLAKAAVAGEIDGVRADVFDIVRRRISRSPGGKSAPTAAASDPWRSSAIGWLREFIECIE